MADQQGTGKHPHKSTEEPYPHHEGGQSGEQNRERGNRSESENKQSSRGNESGDLKEREYKDDKGQVHHHTHTYEEQHK